MRGRFKPFTVASERGNRREGVTPGHDGNGGPRESGHPWVESPWGRRGSGMRANASSQVRGCDTGKPQRVPMLGIDLTPLRQVQSESGPGPRRSPKPSPTLATRAGCQDQNDPDPLRTDPVFQLASSRPLTRRFRCGGVGMEQRWLADGTRPSSRSCCKRAWIGVSRSAVVVFEMGFMTDLRPIDEEGFRFPFYSQADIRPFSATVFSHPRQGVPPVFP
jgi:hypothetical protein